MKACTPLARLASCAAALALVVALAPACRQTGNGGAQQQAAPTRPDDPDEIFRRYTAALGGQEALARINTYVLKGTFQLTGSSGKLPVELYVKKPDRSLMIVQVPGLGTLRRGASGGVAWFQTPTGGLSANAPSELTEVERDHDIYRGGQIRALYDEVRLESRARLSGRDVYIVEGKPAKGPAEKMLFDTESGLLLRWDIVRRRAGSATQFVRVYLDDYQDVGGVRVPFTIRYFLEPRELVLRLDDVQHNVELKDELFAKPFG